MLTITPTINLKNEVEQVVQLKNITEIRVIGEERDESLLLHINEQCEPNTITSRVVLYNQKQKKIKILYTFANEINLFQASINQDHSILAFVSKIEDAGNSFYNRVQYEVWILNIESKQFPECLQIKSYSEITVHFRYYKKMPTKQMSDGCNQFLIISALKKSITLNKITKTDENIMQIGNTEILTRQIFSSQWDASTQCLYFEHIRVPLNVTDRDLIKSSSARPMLTGIQFHDNIHYETVLNVPLELINTGTRLENENQKTDNGKKLSVLTTDSGTVYICQQIIEMCNKGTSGKLTYNYSVMILHHGCIVHSSVIDEGTTNESNSRGDYKITFLLYTENYILAILPGVFVHLLDVGLNHEPCNNILIRDENLLPNNLKVLKYCESIDTPVIILSDELKLATVSITVQNLLSQMESELNLSTKIAIVHHLLVHFKINEEVIKQLIMIIVKKSTCLERSQLFQEFLIGRTFSLCEIGFPSDILKLIPLSSCKYQGSQVEHKSEVTYCTLPHTSLTLSLSQRLRPADCDTWSNLWMHLQKLRYQQPLPFSPQLLRERLMVSMEYVTEDDARFSGYHKLEKLDFDEIFLPFSNNIDSNYSEFEQVLSMNLREISMHISKYFVDKSQGAVDGIADEYVSNQVNVSRRLCYYLLLASEENFFNHDNNLNSETFEFLNHVPQHVLKRLFSLTRDYHTSIKELSYPLPRGFSTFFSLVGFKCLSNRMFLQYVDRGAIQLHSSVVSFIMNSLDDNEENANFKLNVITKLPKNKMWKFLEMWNHSYSQEILERLENAAARRYNSYFVDFRNRSFSDSDRSKLIESLQYSSWSIKTTDTQGSINGN